MLLNAYKAAFNYMGGGNQIYRVKEGENLIKKAVEQRKGFTNDNVVSFKDEINVPAVAQHLGLLTHLKAWSYARQNSFHNCIDTLWIDEKDTINKQQSTHPTCAYTLRQDEVSSRDAVYQK
jgi:hypothetical protein